MYLSPRSSTPTLKNVRRLLGRLRLRSSRNHNRQPIGHSESKSPTRRPRHRNTRTTHHNNITNSSFLCFFNLFNSPSINDHHYKKCSNQPFYSAQRHRRPSPRLWRFERFDVHDIQSLHGFPRPRPLPSHLVIKNLDCRCIGRSGHFSRICTNRVDKVQSSGQWSRGQFVGDSEGVVEREGVERIVLGRWGDEFEG